jgi:Ala-tRNA(Pro) deacylase
MGNQQLKLLKKLLDVKGIHYKLTEHKPVFTSEQAAKVRGVALKTGVKALLLKTNENRFVLGLIAADKKINLKQIATIIGTKRVKLALQDEVLKITGCEIGSVHPFGNLYDLPTYLDSSVLDNAEINFNAGLHSVSMSMNVKDLILVINPIIEHFSQ